MNSLKQKYLPFLRDREFLFSVGLGVAFLLVSFVINYFAGIYATERASGSVTDIILSNIPIFDVDEIFIYGPFVFWIFIVGLIFAKPQRIPFVLKSVALFVIIRSVFVTLTHIGPFPDLAPLDSNLLKYFTSANDLFFSGHTGLPFLMALIFHQNRRLLVLFTVTAIFFGVVVLLAHLHYSIDVLAAFFITYTIYHLASWFFKKDKKMFLSDPVAF
ncbi:MAG: phosphatase PAP2-related protein [Candidatus Paceibacterota bacterium]|jgi:hypothetical protein